MYIHSIHCSSYSQSILHNAAGTNMFVMFPLDNIFLFKLLYVQYINHPHTFENDVQFLKVCTHMTQRRDVMYRSLRITADLV